MDLLKSESPVLFWEYEQTVSLQSAKIDLPKRGNFSTLPFILPGTCVEFPIRDGDLI